MMATAIETLLALIEGLLPSIGASAVDPIVSALVAIVPVIAQEASSFIVPVKNIIAALQSSGSVNPDQLAALQQLDAACDAAFDAAAKNAGA